MNKDFRQAGDDRQGHPVDVRHRADRRSGRCRSVGQALIVNGEKVVLTSGGYSVAFGKQIGMGYVRPDLATPGTKLQVRMLRQLWDAVVTKTAPSIPERAYPRRRLTGRRSPHRR
jgi:glycine cleavage system aminomethyltransferase T